MLFLIFQTIQIGFNIVFVFKHEFTHGATQLGTFFISFLMVFGSMIIILLAFHCWFMINNLTTCNNDVILDEVLKKDKLWYLGKNILE